MKMNNEEKKKLIIRYVVAVILLVVTILVLKGMYRMRKSMTMHRIQKLQQR